MFSFIRGFLAPFRAAKLIATTPVLLGLVLIPFALSCLLFYFFFHFGTDYLIALSTGWMGTDPAWLPHWAQGLSTWLIKIFVWITVGLVSAFSYTTIGGVLLAPINDLLSKKTAQKLGTDLTGVPEFGAMAVMFLELKRSGLLISGGIAAFLVGLIPFLQGPSLIFGALLLSFEYFGFPYSRKTTRLSPLIGFVFRNFLASLGFGLGLFLIMLIPFGGVFYIPLAVVGGTLLYEEIVKNFKENISS